MDTKYRNIQQYQQWPCQPLIRWRNYGNQASETNLKLEYSGLWLKQYIHMVLKHGQQQNQWANELTDATPDFSE